MEKIKFKFKNLSIIPTFILLVVLFILIAMIFIEIEKTILVNAQQEIAFRYSDIVEGFNSDKVWSNNSVIWLSEHDSRMMQIYELLIWIFPPVTYIICLFIAGLIFYNSKIKHPLSLLSSSADRIANNDLDFEIHYDKIDEMGALCSAFEKMRSQLEDNNRDIWRQMHERKRLNAAFSHDLRTPLTVLEGHLGILQKYTLNGQLSMDDTMETYEVMLDQITRLKNYVSSMNTLQRLEDIPITQKNVKAIDFIKSLESIAAIVCTKKQLRFLNQVDIQELNIDSEIVMLAFENLLSNAIRYAKSSILVICKSENNIFSICVADDGKGFDNITIRSATNPFYTTEKNDNSQHFGLGLNICKILCQRHNGSIFIDNGVNDGAYITIAFGMS